MIGKSRSKDLLVQLDELKENIERYAHYESEDNAASLLSLEVAHVRAEGLMDSISREVQAIIHFERSVKL